MAFTFSVVASALHDADAVARLTAPAVEQLGDLGGERTDDPAARPDVPHVVLSATGGVEQQILDTVAARHVVAPWEPVTIVAHPLHNSLPAALEALARLRADGIEGRIVQLPADDLLRTALTDLEALHRIRRARIGLVGTPSDWLVASVPEASAFRARWGAELVDVDIGDTIAAQRSADPELVRPVAVKFTGRGEPTGETMAASALHPALVATIERERVDAVAVRCFDFLTELETSGCVALAELNDTGVVAGCEGDVASTMAMLIARAVLDQPAWIANPASIDVAGDRLVLAHCTVAPSMVDDLELHTHFESGLGIGLRGTFPAGAYTLLRLGGPVLERHWFAEAELEGTGDSDDLCRTQVALRLTDRPARELLDDPLGNHLVMVRGHHRARLEGWWDVAFGRTP